MRFGIAPTQLSTNSSCSDVPLGLLSLSAVMHYTCYRRLPEPVQMHALSVWTVLVTSSSTGPALMCLFSNVCFHSCLYVVM